MHRTALALTLLALLASPAAAASGPRVLGHWRFEATPGAAADGGTVPSSTGRRSPSGSVAAEGGARVTVSDETPGPFVYDPLSGRAHENRTSLRFEPADDGAAHVTVRLPGGGLESFTLEAFVQPAAGLAGNLPIAVLTGAGDAAAPEAGLVTDREHQYTWLGALWRGPDGKGDRWNVGYYLGSGRLTKETSWRHVALVYDAEARRFTFWLDHFQHGSRDAGAALAWDDAALLVGGRPGAGGKGFAGHVDEVRLTAGVLPRTQFLRARDTPARGVSFESASVVYPEDAGAVDLKRAFGAAGDGRTDDTCAFRDAFRHLPNKVPLKDYTLYVPPGEYLIRDEIRWTRFLFVQGAGPDRTVIRLKDRCPGYGDPEHPKAAVTAAWQDFTPEATGKAGNVIGNYLHGVTIDVGRGNPGVVAFAWHTNNHGSMANVVLRAADGSGWAGLALADNWPGPGLVRDVTIRGFDRGIYSIVGQYSMTFRHLTLEGQRDVGIYNRGQMLWIDGLTSRNRVPVLDASGIVVLVGGRFAGGNPSVPAIRLRGGYGLYRDLAVQGYSSAIHYTDEKKPDAERTVPGPRVDEVVFGKRTSLFDSPETGLDLPRRDPPDAGREPPDRWVNVNDFADRADGDDWAPAVQAAIDAGARTVYFPNRMVCKVRSPVHARRSLVRLVGLASGLDAHKGYDGPVLVYDHPDRRHVLVIDRCRTGRLHHASPAALVIRDASPNYTNEPGAGPLFAEGTQGRYRIREQDAWFWQLNTEFETGQGEARFENRGGRVRIVGMKTEQKGANILTADRGRTELLGGYFYPNSGTGGQPSIIIENAGFSGTWRNYWAKYEPVVRETRGGETRGGGERYQGLFTGYPAR